MIDGVINGRPRKLVSTAARNGYFYTLDRVTGEHLVTTRYGTYSNWGKEMRPTGVITPNPGKEATIPGSLVSPVEGGVTNWPPPAFSPDTGLFYVQEHNGFNMVYLTDPDPRGSMGLGGKSVAGLGTMGDFLTAIDYRSAGWVTAWCRTPAHVLQVPASVPLRGRRFHLVTERFVEVAHRYGKQVHVWTIDDPDEMHRLLDLGVDGLVSDRIDVLKDVLVQRGVWTGAR